MIESIRLNIFRDEILLLKKIKNIVKNIIVILAQLNGYIKIIKKNSIN